MLNYFWILSWKRILRRQILEKSVTVKKIKKVVCLVIFVSFWLPIYLLLLLLSLLQ